MAKYAPYEFESKLLNKNLFLENMQKFTNFYFDIMTQTLEQPNIEDYIDQE